MDLIFYFLPSAAIKFRWSFLGKDLSSKTGAVSGTNTRFPHDLFDYFESNRFYEWLEIQPAHNYANRKKKKKKRWATPCEKQIIVFLIRLRATPINS